MKKGALLFLFIFNISFAQTYLARVIEKNRFGYINTEGEYVIEPQFKEAKDFSSNGLAPASDGKKWGFINTKGEWIIQPKYTFAQNFHSGYAIVEANNERFYIDINEKLLKTPETDKLYEFNNDGVAFIRNGDQVGLINTKGEIILKPRFSIIRPFNNKYARVRSEKGWGIIDINGSIIVEPEYDEIGEYYNEIVSVRKGKLFALITNGKTNVIQDATKILSFEGDAELAPARKNNKFGFINKEGKWVVEPKFKKVKSFYYGLAPARGKGGWGYINTKGEWVIKPQFEETEIFSEDGIAFYKKSDFWGLIDKKGNKLTKAIYKITPEFLEYSKKPGYINGLARVKYHGKWGFINIKGKPIANKWFDNAEFFIEINNNEL